MDYLLRDSYHAGVQYGRFDLNRVVNTVRAIPGARGRAPRFGITEGGCHAAEGLVLARYFMFTQVYFHKTRVAYDVHLKGALKEFLPNRQFPKPTGTALKEFLSWDDWKVLGLLAEGKGGEHGSRLANRKHYRLVYRSPEAPVDSELLLVDRLKQELGHLVVAIEEASKNWYKTGETDIPVVSDVDSATVLPLSRFSSVIRDMKPNNQLLLYALPEEIGNANSIVKEVLDNERNRQGTLGFDSEIS